MITRRQTLIALGGALAPLITFAQQQGKVWRVGYLGPGKAAVASNVEALRTGLRELGYVDGKNLLIEYRWAEGKAERLPGLAAELVRLNVDLIVTSGGVGATAAGLATRRIPIVVAVSGDLVALGLAASLAKPGGNVTGQIYFAEALQAKWLELLKETLPGLTRVAVLRPPAISATKLATDTITATAKHLKLDIPFFTVQEVTDFEGAFASMVKQRAGAVLVSDHALLNFNVKTSADIVLRHRLPSSGILAFAEAGGMLGYGVNFAEMFRRAAALVDKIFRGTKPGDIPIEQATKFELIVNMKTAKTLGIKVPQSILVQATTVIE